MKWLTIKSLMMFQIRRDSSLVPLRRLSSDKVRKFVYPDFPGPKPGLDSAYRPPKVYKDRTEMTMKDNVL